MSTNTDVVQGALKLIGLPDEQCWTSTTDFIAWFVKNVGVEIPPEVSNVVVSNVEPKETSRDAVWFRKDNSGNFVGIYLFAQGTWNKIYPIDGQLFRISGDSRNIPKGFALADTNQQGISTDMFTWLKSTWLPHSSNTYYLIFDVVYVGF